MSINSFNKLDIDSQGTIAFGDGARFISFRKYYNHKLSLYSYKDFFIEVWYFPEENRIVKIEAIPEDDKRIDRYIDFAGKAGF